MTNCEKSAWTLAVSWPVVRRAMGYSVVVGLVLSTINHGDCLVQGHFGADGCWYKSVLTAVVPYVVSTMSSVQAMLNVKNDCGQDPLVTDA